MHGRNNRKTILVFLNLSGYMLTAPKFSVQIYRPSRGRLYQTLLALAVDKSKISIKPTYLVHES